MKKLIIAAACGLVLTSCAAESNEIKVNMPADGAPKEIIVARDLISDMAAARQRTDLKTVYDTIAVKDGKAVIPIDQSGPASYMVTYGGEGLVTLYAAPGEKLTIDITSYDPPAYTVSGTRLMDDITAITAVTEPLDSAIIAKMQAGTVTEADQMEYMRASDAALRDFVKKNPDSPAVVYALFNLQGESFKNVYDSISPAAKESILMPIVQAQVDRQGEVDREMKAADARRAEMTKGDKDAPAFTLKNLQGKDVSLSDFRGKWVVLDFWGSWCGWCVRGIPALKDAYKQYAGKLEVIGIDCNESEADWRAGVAKYELPWVNVYNNQKDGALLNAYGVQGFPTKAIVNPQGKLVDITIGEDPSFYDKLASFINGK